MLQNKLHVIVARLTLPYKGNRSGCLTFSLTSKLVKRTPKQYDDECLPFKADIPLCTIGPLQLAITACHAGEQTSHWDKTNKGN